ncbi:NXPE family member 3-like [Haliotis rufescens]|uniref:NXPE family member 3-like n=1 Tax=Haliotis rufescens TaxID=6454 RepID=UPI00201F652F|nr:NXPE family member 3-like [Haliotis rufescens]
MDTNYAPLLADPFLYVNDSEISARIGKVKTRGYFPTRGTTYLTEEVISYGHVSVISLCANAKKSRVSLNHAHKVYSLGEQIQVQVDLYDLYGNRKLTGGDVLRVWMENPETAASVSSRVSDHNNGSYTALLRAAWSGSATIKAFIASRKEEVVLSYMIYQQHGSLWTVLAEFRANNLTDATACSVRQGNSFKTNEWCNFTNENNGYSWYCKKSKIKQLTCDTWSHSFSANDNMSFHLNNTERSILDWPLAALKQDVLQSSVRVSVGGGPKGVKLSAPSTSCSALPAEMTWRRTSPNGYFHQNKWHSLLCTDTLPRTIDAYRQCLKGRRLWLHGDSTSRQFKEVLHSILRFPSHSDRHVPVTDTDLIHKFSISYHAHELPFYHGPRHFKKSVNQAQYIMVDRLPNTTKDIVVLNMYAHFVFVHPDVFRRHVQRLVPSVRNLLARAPNVTIAVRGPHAFFTPMRGVLSYWGNLYTDIWHEEFASLQDKIVYLDFWDLTMAKPSQNIHPNTAIVKEMVHNMMSLLCFRK